MLPFLTYCYSRPFCAAVPHMLKPVGKAAQKPRPPPGRNQKVKIVSRFLQIIHAALFCAAFIRSIKTHPQSRDKKARLRHCVTSTATGKHGTHPQGITRNPARRPAGRGQGKGANPSRPLPLRFPPEQKNSGVPAARVFSIFPKQLHRPF